MKTFLPLNVLIYSLVGVIQILYTPPLRGKVYSSFHPMVKENLDCVVNIRTNTYTSREPHLDLYHRFNRGTPPLIPSQTSLGTGLILDDKGFIVTTFQVISGSKEIFVKTKSSNKIQKARVIGLDRKSNLGLLQIVPPPSTCKANLADSDKIKLGDLILTIGYPFGKNHLITHGILSSKGSVFGTNRFHQYFLTDAPISASNIGGPIIDIRGRLVGIGMLNQKGSTPLNYIIPMNKVLETVKALKNSGKIIRPWLGIIAKNLQTVENKELPKGNKDFSGIIVGNLIVPSPAHKAGLNIGDIITKIDNSNLRSVIALHQKMRSYNPEDQITLEIYRRSKGYLKLPVQLEEMPKSSEIPSEDQLF